MILTSRHLAGGVGKSALPRLIPYTNQCSSEDSHIATEAIGRRSAEREIIMSKVPGYQLSAPTLYHRTEISVSYVEHPV